MSAGKLIRPWLANHAPKYRKLLDDIESFVAPYRQTSSKPNLPLEQLVVVAVCFNPNRPGTLALKWLVSHFRYYQNIVNSDFSTGTSWGTTRDFRQDFFDAICKLDVPIMTRETEQGPAGEGSRLRVAPDEARVFLGLNRTESTTSFRFMDLPPEIRNTIYEMALSFPKAGINIRPYKSQNRVHALTKDRIKSVSPLKWFSTPTDYSHDQEIALQGRTLSEYLDMFRTSKQFYAEAMPIFYSTNTFVAIDNNELNVLMKQTPEHRRKHFEHVVFLLHPKDLGYGRRIRSDGNLTKNYSGMEALKRVPDLKKLDVVMWEEEWLAVRKTTKQRAFKYTDILKIPPMPILEQFRGLTKVTFHGNCDTVKSHLEPLMTRARVQEDGAENAKPIKTTKKRKAKSAGSTDTSMKKRVKKA